MVLLCLVLLCTRCVTIHHTFMLPHIQFNMDVEEVEAVRPALEQWRRDISKPLAIQIFLQHNSPPPTSSSPSATRTTKKQGVSTNCCTLFVHRLRCTNTCAKMCTSPSTSPSTPPQMSCWNSGCLSINPIPGVPLQLGQTSAAAPPQAPVSSSHAYDWNHPLYTSDWWCSCDPCTASHVLCLPIACIALPR